MKHSASPYIWLISTVALGLLIHNFMNAGHVSLEICTSMAGAGMASVMFLADAIVDLAKGKSRNATGSVLMALAFVPMTLGLYLGRTDLIAVLVYGLILFSTVLVCNRLFPRSSEERR
jgi:hypothetical protein